MAKINVNLNSVNNVLPIDGKYRFVVRFYNNSGVLINDPRFPQDQVVDSDTTLPDQISIDVGEGEYTINNVIADLFAVGVKVGSANLSGIVVDCTTPSPCTTPIYGSHTLTPPTCIEGVTSNIGSLQVTGLQNYNRYRLYSGTPTSGGYEGATPSTDGTITIPVNYPTSAGTTNYTLRLYNGTDTCINNLTFSVSHIPCSAEIITDELFPQISYIGITRDNTTRETSLYFTSSESLLWRVSAVSGTQPSGKTVNGLDWNNTTWNPIETEWAVPPITHIARINPISHGVGGLVGGVSYNLDFRLFSNPNLVYRMIYTIPNNNISPMLEITNTGGGGGSCDKTGFLSAIWRGNYNSHGDAESAACNDSGSGSTGSFSTGLNIGSTAYINTINGDCELLPDGFYYFKTGSTVFGSTARVQSGEITELAPTNCGGSVTWDRSVGTKEFTVGDRYYKIIHSRNTSVNVTGGNLVQITAPLTKPSFNGLNTCYRHIINHNHAEVPSNERDPLFSTGLDLPEGNHEYHIVYANTNGGGPNYNQVFEDTWYLFSNQGIGSNGQTYMYNRSAMVENVSISVSKIVESPSNVVKPPRQLRDLSWLPSFQSYHYDLNGLPSHQSFGTTKILTIGKNESDKVAGINSNIDLNFRMQYTQSELDSAPAKNKWRNVQAYVGGSISTNAEAIANSYYGGRDLMTMLEVAENVGNHVGCPPCNEVSREVSVQLNNKAVSQGATSPLDHENYGDYFQALMGEDNGANYRSESNGRMLMASQANARLMSINPSETDNYATSHYFTGSAYNVRNWVKSGYLDSPIFGGKAGWIYELIFGLERKFMAAPDRKVMTFASSTFEGVHMDTIRAGTDLRLFFENENGDLMRRSAIGMPWGTMYTHALYTYLLGGSYVIWDSSGFSNIDPYGWSWGMWNVNIDNNHQPIPSSLGWQPTGGSIVQFNPNDPSHPTRNAGNSGEFPSNVLHGENGAYSAALVYKQLKVTKDYLSNTLEWSNYSYTINGGPTINGYAGTNVPITGSNGTKLNMFGSPNYGGSNIVTSTWYKKPISWYMNGADGSATLFHNPHAASTDVHVVTTGNGGGKTFTVIGNQPHIEKH